MVPAEKGKTLMSVYADVTARIVAMLEAGTRPWSQPWAAGQGPARGRPLRSCGTPYRGVNTLNLWAAGMSRGFSSPYWLTFKGALDLGGNVKKGAKSERAFYVGTITKTDERDDEDVERIIPFMKSFCVFNADECENLPAKFYATQPAAIAGLSEADRLAQAEAFAAGTGARIDHGGHRAFYMPSEDRVQMPDFAAFSEAAGYYSVLLHELTHWTGAPARLDRLRPGARYGNPEYAFEELVAELGAAFLCADLAITNSPREDHAAYIGGWLKALKSDERAIFAAAALAEKAAAFLHGAQPGAELAEAA